MDNNITPETIFNALRQTVIGQDEYLRTLSNAAWLHSMRHQHYRRTEKLIDRPKQSILCIGPSGTGKTLAIEQLGKLLELPVIIENASALRGEGWRGRSVSSIIKRCIESAPGQCEAIHSIVCLDEIDKVFKSSQSNMADNSFLPIDNLLTFIAGGVVTHDGNNNRTYTMDTSNLLIICLGAFDGLKDIIQKRLKGKSSIGFSTEMTKELPEDPLQHVTEEDLHTYGISHEFLGRISLITHTNPLTLNDYSCIITSDASPVYQYDNLLYNTMGIHVDITDEAVTRLSEEAQSNKEGARMLARRVSELIQPSIFTSAGDESVDSIEIGIVDGGLCAYQTHLGRDEVWWDGLSWEERDKQVLSSVPLICIRGRNEIIDLAKEIKNASPSRIVIPEEEIIAAVYILAAAIALQLMENNGKDLTMEQVDQMLDMIQDGSTDCNNHPLAKMSREFIAESEQRIPDVGDSVVEAKQFLIDYCNVWLNNRRQAEL